MATLPCTVSISVAIIPILDPLLKAWCDRREFKALRLILRAYPQPAGVWLTDQCMDLIEALKDVKGLCHGELPREEIAEVTKALILLQDSLENR